MKAVFVRAVAAASIATAAGAQTTGGIGQTQIPVDPLPASTIKWVDASGEHEKYWAAIPEAQKRLLMPSAEAFVRISQEETNGSFTVLPLTASFKKGKYQLLFRWQQFRAEYCQADNPGAGRVRTGVALEIVADIRSKKSGLSLANFGSLTSAADRNQVEGGITIRQIGLGSSSPTLGTYLANFALTQEGVTKALEAIAVTKAVLENDKTVLTPHYLSFTETSPGSCSQALPASAKPKS
jgi:hypothetical protein